MLDYTGRLAIDNVQLTIGLAVAAVVVTIVALIVQDIPMVEYTRPCAERAGENWTYVNESLSVENSTIACEAPNGTTTRVSAYVNASSGL